LKQELLDNTTIKHKTRFTYEGNQQNTISFPLGGIGTGCIGLAGNGRLIDWEIFNKPNKNSYNGFSFFAIKAEHEGKIKLAKILNGDLNPPFIGTSGKAYRGFGFGVDREALVGFPHFRKTKFKGEFPVAEIEFEEESSLLDIKLSAFNPLIPLNDKDSSLPVAIFTYEVMNRSNEELDISIIGNLTNPFTEGSVNHFVSNSHYKGIKLSSTSYGENDREFGDLTLSTNGESTSHQSYWYRGGWFDNLTVFWKEFNTPGKFTERNYTEQRERQAGSSYNYLDVCLLGNHRKLSPGEKGTFRFIISWNFPNCVNFWNPGSGASPQWKNYYATLFADSTESAGYVWQNFNRLHEETTRFKETLFGSTLPDYVIDAISSNLSILKSPTVLRLTDGTLYGFEGCHSQEGCCEGSCTHVWNYEQATPFLFPGLARSMRKVDYQFALFDSKKMSFRLMLPVERTLTDISKHSGATRAAADGQMGGIIKVYREWKISGDTQWLKSIWPGAKKALEYAWDPSNSDWWDKDFDGVMEGEQHHTLDVEIYGPNTYITGIYHCALLAAAEMAEALGENAAKSTYLELYRKGREWVDQNLFNGEYFHQHINLQDSRFPIDKELGEIKYQVGEGCHIDQVIGQWHAHIVGLGYILDENKVKRSLESIYKYNFISMRDYANACRVYALNDEKGLVICTWPKENSPKVPIPYAEECMNGFEYQAACHMIYEGLTEQGMEVVKAIRDRYDGERRNPWNEFECGSNYARSMASYSLLLAFSGFQYDMVQGRIGFSPKIHQGEFRSFWSLHSGWGEFEWKNGSLELKLLWGYLDLSSFQSETIALNRVSQVSSGGQTVPFEQKEDILVFPDNILISENQTLKITFKQQ
jgi:non-lysosomal glucosylceramidase